MDSATVSRLPSRLPTPTLLPSSFSTPHLSSLTSASASASATRRVSYSYALEGHHLFYTDSYPSPSPRQRSASLAPHLLPQHQYQLDPQKLDAQDPVESIAGRTTPFFFGTPSYGPLPRSNTFGQGEETPKRVPWSSPESPDDLSWSYTSSPDTSFDSFKPYSPSNSRRQSGTASPTQAQLSYLMETTSHLAHDLGNLSSAFTQLSTRLSSLESSLVPPRAAFPPSQQPYYVPSQTSKLQPSAMPYTPPSQVSRPSSPSMLSYSQPPFPPPFSSGLERAKSFDPGMSTSFGRGAPKKTFENQRGRGVSFSALAPIVAQAKWSSGAEEPINYRALLEQDADVDASVFVRRVISHSDQQCSLYLQQRLKSPTCSEATRDDICESVGEHVVELTLAKFGNYLVSTCLQVGTPELRALYTKKLKGFYHKASIDPYGCHVVQKILDVGSHETKEMIFEELLPHPETFTIRSSGHVWSRILASSNSPSVFRRISESGKGNWLRTAMEETGSLLVQSVLENWIWTEGAKDSEIVQECLEGLEELAGGQWGSFVAIHLVERRGTRFQNKILASAAKLARHPCSAKVLEKTLRICHHAGTLSPSIVTDLVGELCVLEGTLPMVVKVASHTAGAQLVLTLLTSWIASADNKARLRRVLSSISTKDAHAAPPSFLKVYKAVGDDRL